MVAITTTITMNQALNHFSPMNNHSPAPLTSTTTLVVPAAVAASQAMERRSLGPVWTLPGGEPGAMAVHWHKAGLDHGRYSIIVDEFIVS